MLCDDHRYASVSTARGITSHKAMAVAVAPLGPRAASDGFGLAFSLFVKVDMLGLWLQGKLDLLRSASELEKRV